MEVYYLREKDDPSWRYEFTCPRCEQPITIFLPVAEPKHWGGRIPDCPFCGALAPGKFCPECGTPTD